MSRNRQWVRFSRDGAEWNDFVEWFGEGRAETAVEVARANMLGPWSRTRHAQLDEVSPGKWEGTIRVYVPVLGEYDLAVAVEQQ